MAPFCSDLKLLVETVLLTVLTAPFCFSTLCGSRGGESRRLHFVLTSSYVYKQYCCQVYCRYNKRAIIGNAGRKLGYREVLKFKAMFLVTSN